MTPIFFYKKIMMFFTTNIDRNMRKIVFFFAKLQYIYLEILKNNTVRKTLAYKLNQFNFLQ